MGFRKIAPILGECQRQAARPRPICLEAGRALPSTSPRRLPRPPKPGLRNAPLAEPVSLGSQDCGDLYPRYLARNVLVPGERVPNGLDAGLGQWNRSGTPRVSIRID